MREEGKSGIHLAEVSVFARMTGKNRHFCDLSQQVLSGVVAFTSPDVISTSPKNLLTSRIYFTVLQLSKFLIKHHLPVGHVKNRIP